MSDPKQIAHDKKVAQEKKHNHEEIAPDAIHKPQPGKKPHLAHHASDEKKGKNQDGDELTEEAPANAI